MVLSEIAVDPVKDVECSIGPVKITISQFLLSGRFDTLNIYVIVSRYLK